MMGISPFNDKASTASAARASYSAESKTKKSRTVGYTLGYDDAVRLIQFLGDEQTYPGSSDRVFSTVLPAKVDSDDLASRIPHRKGIRLTSL
jgi:hypothetical protein